MRGTAEKTERMDGTASKRFKMGGWAITGKGVETTEPAVEQTGQMWEADGPVVRSVQK